MDEDQIIIDVDIDVAAAAQKLSDVIKRMAELKTQQKELSKTIREGNDANGQAAEQYAKNEAELAKLKAQQKDYTTAVQQQTGVLSGYGDTLNGMRARLTDMQKAYDGMTKAQRESVQGQDFKRQMDAQYEAVSQLEQATGRHQRNVGNYPKIITALIPGFDRLQNVIAGMGAAMASAGAQGTQSFGGLSGAVSNFGKMFMTPPMIIVSAVLGAILLVVNKLREAIAKNDTASTNMQRAFAALQPVVTAVNKAFAALAETISGAVVAVAKVTEKIAGAAAALFGMRDAYESANKAAADLVMSTDALEESERQYTVNSAKRTRDITDLRAKAADKERYSAKEREQLLQQAIDLEKQNLADQKAIAAERLRLLQMEAEQNADTSDDMQNKIAEATAAMYKAEEEYATGTRRLTAQISAAKQEQASEARAAARAKEQAAKEAAEAEKQAAKEAAEAEKQAAETRRQIRRELEDAMLNTIDDATDQALAKEELRSKREQDELRVRYEALAATEVEARDALAQLIELKAQEHQDNIREIAQTAWEQERQEREAQWLEDVNGELEKAEATYLAKQEQLQQLRDLDAEHKALMFASDEEYQTAVLEAQEAYTTALADYDQKATESANMALQERQKTARQNAAAMAGALSGLMAILDEFGEQNKAAAIASKTIALGQIAVQTGIAIAEGIAAANAVPFPANIAAIETTVGAVLVNIATAISTVKSAKFARGGVVPGTSYEGDKVMAYLNSGEVVLNKDQAANTLYMIANSGSMGVADSQESMRNAFADALLEMPSPTLVYEEFSQFQQNTTQLKQFATL